jgi:Tfp pilus assembly protein PilF
MGMFDRFRKKRAPKDRDQSRDLSNKGLHLVQSGRLDEDIVILKQAIELDPNNAMTHMNLGAHYLMIGRVNQAIVELKRAIEIDPNYADAHFNLAVVYYGSGRFDLAWKHVRIAEKLGMPTQNIVQFIAALRKVSREP